MRRIAIVGASLAGLRAAEALRRAGYDGALALIGAESHPPTTVPPLSKEILQSSGSPSAPRSASPAREVKPGIVPLAAPSGALIVLVYVTARWRLEARSWDRMQIPFHIREAYAALDAPTPISPIPPARTSYR